MGREAGPADQELYTVAPLESARRDRVNGGAARR